jgi:hypothetical protein
MSICIVSQNRACELSALFAPVALTRDIFLLVLRAAPAKPAEKERKWPAKRARIQGKGRIHKPCIPECVSFLVLLDEWLDVRLAHDFNILKDLPKLAYQLSTYARKMVEARLYRVPTIFRAFHEPARIHHVQAR